MKNKIIIGLLVLIGVLVVTSFMLNKLGRELVDSVKDISPDLSLETENDKLNVEMNYLYDNKFETNNHLEYNFSTGELYEASHCVEVLYHEMEESCVDNILDLTINKLGETFFLKSMFGTALSLSTYGEQKMYFAYYDLLLIGEDNNINLTYNGDDIEDEIRVLQKLIFSRYVDRLRNPDLLLRTYENNKALFFDLINATFYNENLKETVDFKIDSYVNYNRNKDSEAFYDEVYADEGSTFFFSNSFWFRRAAEGNAVTLSYILKDIKAHYSNE